MEQQRKDQITVFGGPNFFRMVSTVVDRSSRNADLLSCQSIAKVHEVMGTSHPDIMILSAHQMRTQNISFLVEIRNRYEFVPIIVVGEKSNQAAHYLQNRADEFYTQGEFIYLDFDRTFLSVLQRSLIRDKHLNIIDSLRKSLQYRTEFTAQLSHEIRNPLNGILGMVSLLNQTALDENQKELVQNIQSSGDTLLGLTNDVLDISKLSAGKLKIVSEPFSIRETINQCIETFSSLGVNKGLLLGSFIEKDIPTVINGDCFRVRQVISNLLSNAIKFTESGLIEICASINREKSDQLILYVKDSGYGIESDLQAKLFQPYQQLAVEDRVKGTGLGLSICKQLAVAMGGNIGVESKVGEGSTFWFSIKVDNLVAPQNFGARSPLENKKIGIFSQSTLFIDLVSKQIVERGMDYFVNLNQEDWNELDLALFDMANLGSEELKALEQNQKSEFDDFPKIFIGNGEKCDNRIQPYLNSSNQITHLKQDMLYIKICKSLRLEEGSRSKELFLNLDHDDSRYLGMKILVVDDNAVNIQVAAKMLRHFGCVVSTGISGNEALNYLNSEDFDCVFLDYDLTDMYGFEICDKVRHSKGPNCQTPIYALTGYTTEKHHKKCIDAGMQGVLVKPIDLVSLKAVLQSVVDASVTTEKVVLESSDNFGDHQDDLVEDVDFQRINDLRELEDDKGGAFIQYILTNFHNKVEKRLEDLKTLHPNSREVGEIFRDLLNASENLGANLLKSIIESNTEKWADMSKADRNSILTDLHKASKAYFDKVGVVNVYSVEDSDSIIKPINYRYVS